MYVSRKKYIHFKYMKRFIAIGNRIKELRGRKSQKDFAKMLGISLPALQNYEYGERAPKGPTLERMANACNVSVDFILTGALSEAEHAQIMRVTDAFFEVLKDLPEKDQKELLKLAKEKKMLRKLIKERKKPKDAG